MVAALVKSPRCGTPQGTCGQDGREFGGAKIRWVISKHSEFSTGIAGNGHGNGHKNVMFTVNFLFFG